MGLCIGIHIYECGCMCTCRDGCVVSGFNGFKSEPKWVNRLDWFRPRMVGLGFS